MKYIKHRIAVPESNSFQINKLNMNKNTDIIHSHKNYELNFIHNGKGRRFIGGKVSNYFPGDLVLMGPDLAHCWEVDNPEEMPVSITIHFQEELFDSKLFSVPEFNNLQKMFDRAKYGLHFVNIDKERIQNYLEDLKEMHRCESMIQILKILGHLTTVEQVQVISSSEAERVHDETELKRINKVYDYVFRNFTGEIRLKEAADLVNLSESAFCSYFKKRTRKTFSGFIKEIRIGYACKLLSDHIDKNIAQICYESGFNNLANFNRQFKEITKMSPRQYRLKYSVNAPSSQVG